MERECNWRTLIYNMTVEICCLNVICKIASFVFVFSKAPEVEEEVEEVEEEEEEAGEGKMEELK